MGPTLRAVISVVASRLAWGAILRSQATSPVHLSHSDVAQSAGEHGVPPAVAGWNAAPPSWNITRVEQMLANVHAMLDAAMDGDPNPEGHSGQVSSQTAAYVAVAARARARTVCEIGFNAGHGAASLMAGSPYATLLVAFDLGEHSYVVPALSVVTEFLRSRTERSGIPYANASILYVPGNSIVTVPEFRSNYPHVSCDIFHVDGGHYGDVPQLDLYHAVLMTPPGGVLLMDDFDPACTGEDQTWAWCNMPTRAWQRAIADGLIWQTEAHVVGKHRGYAVGIVPPDAAARVRGILGN